MFAVKWWVLLTAAQLVVAVQSSCFLWVLLFRGHHRDPLSWLSLLGSHLFSLRVLGSQGFKILRFLVTERNLVAN